MIKIKNLCFNRGKKQILKNINFNAEEGSVISILGPNGSGKSTLLKCIVNLLKTEKNTIHISDKAIEKYNKKTLSKYISFLPQIQETLEGLTVYELVALGRSTSWSMEKNDEEKILKTIKYMNLQNMLHIKINNLSGGERQKVLIAMALVRDTPIIVMDEPVTYMDIRNQWELLEIIKDLKKSFNKTIIGVFHDINHAIEISDLVYLIKDGEIYKKGSPHEVITKENLKEVYKIDTHIYSRICNIKKCRKFSVVPIGM